MRRLILGGESLPGALAARVRERLPHVDLNNTYGPSEAATVAGVPIDERDDDGGIVPIGRSMDNTQIYLLDPRGEPVPVGVTGELHIGGQGVARGYLDRPAQTAERFIPNPFSKEPGARRYRTGDLGRWRPNAMVDFLGRTDFQVKIRGIRVEPGEIETLLNEHPQVRQAVVVTREDTPGEIRLVAYYVESEPVELEALRRFLQERLPEHMVPAAYVRLDAFPLTPSRKLDRKALPAPADDAYARQGFEAPEGETESALAEIWSELLGVERVSRNDHFFSLGGHSLMATKLTLRINQAMEINLPLTAVFEFPVLAQLAERVVDAQLAQFDPEALAALLG
jgi:non-ribosomal peptide synthetase component F